MKKYIDRNNNLSVSTELKWRKYFNDNLLAN